jgi:hypothetical protein
MNTTLRELYTDLRAAVMIGIPDGVYEVLQTIQSLPDEDLRTRDLYDLGTCLVPLNIAELRSLAEDANPVVRAMAAVGIADRYLKSDDIVPDDLYLLAEDTSPEVRTNLVKALTSSAGIRSQAELYTLCETWITAAPLEKNQHLVEAGLRLLPSVNPDPQKVAQLLSPLHTAPDNDFRAALVETLAELAPDYAEIVLDVLQEWAIQPDANVWVITQALSSSWSFEHSPRATKTLNTLAENIGTIRAVRRALGRHEGDSPAD